MKPTGWMAASILAAMVMPMAFVAGGEEPLDGLSDEFTDSGSLAQWQRIEQVEKSGPSQLKRVQVDPGAGVLVLEPYTSVWYRDYRGVLLFKPVAGDFIATMRLSVSGHEGKGAPRSQFSLAGIMARTPREVTPQTWAPGGENYVFLSLGSADHPGQYQLEVKTTRNSDSQLQVSDGAAQGELRCVRVGSTMILLHRLAGSWVIHRRFDRPDMPRVLQVGITCYTDWPTCQNVDPATHNRTVIRAGRPDLLARIDYFRLRRPTVPPALRGRDLADPSDVSDSELLGFLGDSADTPTSPGPAARAASTPKPAP